MWTYDVDGSIIDQSGKIIFFSLERFIRDVCLGLLERTGDPFPIWAPLEQRSVGKHEA